MKDYKKHLKEVILPKVQKELGVKNVLAVPRLEKIMVNVGIGTRMKESKDYSDIVENIASITGQKPIVIKARKAISNFKLRAGSPNGVMVTLRRRKMIDFFNRLVNVAFPRIRDFQGFSEKAFDGRGNLTIGIRDCSIFPEVNPDDLSRIHGLNITIVTSAGANDPAKLLLQNLNFPFKKPSKA